MPSRVAVPPQARGSLPKGWLEQVGRWAVPPQARGPMGGTFTFPRRRGDRPMNLSSIRLQARG